MMVAQYRVLELGGSFAVIAYDDRGKPMQGHPLGSVTFATRADAEAALAAYRARAPRTDRGR